MNSAIFLDRDGVIIENCDKYVRSWDDVKFLPLSLQALNLLNQTTYKIIITSNQSVVGRGIISEEQSQEINRRIIEDITSVGGRVDGIFVCPHIPEDHCSCRKPKPGLILQAAQALSIDLPSSIMIGDALTDIVAGSAAGIKTLIMVKTGRGKEQYKLSLSASYPSFVATDNLLTAISLLSQF